MEAKNESIYYNNALLKQAIQGTFITRIMFKLLEKARKNALSEIQVVSVKPPRV